MIHIIKKWNSILSKGQKIRVTIIVIMMIIGAFLESIGVSLVFPLVTVVLDENIIETNKYARFVCEVLDLRTARSFMLLLIITFILVYIFKTVFLLLEYHVQYRFVFNNQRAVRVKLLETYLNRPYEYYLSISTGEIMRVLGDDVRNAFILLINALNFLTEILVALTLLITIIIVNPFMAVAISVILLLLLLLISRILKPILRNAGLVIQKNSAISNKWVLQSVTGIKDVKISNREIFFAEQFSKYEKKKNDAEEKYNTLNNVPRLLIEAVSMCAILGLIGILIWNGREMRTLLPQLSAFALAAVRLLPSANRMSTALGTIAYSEPALDKLIKNLKEVEQYNGKKAELKEEEKDARDSEFHLDREIKFSHITFRYPESEGYVLADAEMVIPVGQSIGIIGASGAGKTTVVDVLLGLLKPQEGEVLADGRNIERNYRQWLSKIGYIPQTIFLLDDSIMANIAFGIEENHIEEQAVWSAIEEAQLGDFVRNLPEGIHTTIGERGVRLSGGQRQRLGIARALYANPGLLIFDEATSALDNETETAVMEAINKFHGKKTMIIIAHRLSTIAECNIIYKVEGGKIVRQG